MPERSGGLPAWLLPIVTSGVALVVGLSVGTLGTWLLLGGPATVEVPRELTQAELEAACAPFVEVASTELAVAREKVDVLRSEVARKEAQIADMEAEMKQRNERGAAFASEFNRMKAELEDLRARLTQAEAEKAALVEELQRTVEQLEQTEVALERQTELTDIARDDALANKWSSFVNDAQLEICEKGNRNKLGKCRETVVAKLDASMRDRYQHCIRAGQEAPVMRELEKDEVMPRFGKALDEEDKVTKGWYLLLCDPTLPEADGLADLPGLRGAAPSSGLPDLE
jgi:predicted  nucleic acid-binding Zn-ribbon protein